MKKRLTAAFLCLCLLFTLLPATAFAEGEVDSGTTIGTSGLCEHHTQHDESCGYTEGTAEIPCSHEHTEDCYKLVAECVHEHTAECYPAESVSENTATPSEPEEAEPSECTHECSEESGCITETLDCKHTHDEACGYVPATEGTPCTFVCEVCNAQDSGNPAAPSDAQPEECTCETLCTEEEINADCPVCSAEGAELDKVCVGAALLLAAPTLRTGGIEIYVGGQRITESGCYENKSGTWTKVDGTEPASGQFYYDADTVTLTLNGVEISRDQPVSVGSGKYYHGSVIAFSQSADVSLKIVVSQGTSNITGSGGIRVMSEAGDASLSISGPGSLEVNVNSNDSGITLIGSQNVNLNIDGADVKTLAAYFYGVDLYAGDGFKAAAVVNNGKLTAGGSGGIGIYYRWTNPSNSGTSSLTVSGNAVVDTRDSKILISSEAREVQVSAGSDGNGGIVFDGKSGSVYGDVTLQEDVEIGTDETLTIGKDASLTVPDGQTLTNNGTINVESGGKLEGTTTGNGTITIAPTITTTSLSNGTVDTAYSQTFEATGDAPVTWSVTNGSLPAGLSLSENGKITGTPTTEGTSTFAVTATNNIGSDSREFTLKIGKPAFIPVTDLELNKNTLTLQEKDSDTLIATVKPDDATNKDVTWKSSDTNIATVSEDGTVTAISAGTATITATAKDESGVSASCSVTVTHGKMVHTPKKDATCTMDGNEAYWTCDTCGKHFSDAEGKTEILLEDTVIKVTGHKLIKTEAKAPTCAEAGNKEYWTCDICGKHFSDAEGKTEISLEDTVIKATGHKLIKTEAKAPTCAEVGNKEYWTCDTCGKHFSDAEGKTEISLEDTVIKATGHKLIKTEAKQPTCTEDGNKAYWTCDTCGKIFSDVEGKNEIKLADTVIDAKGHGTTELKNQKEATCTEEGYTGNKVCKDCGTVLEKGKSAPKIAHNYKNGKCTVCDKSDPNYKSDTDSPQTGDNSNMMLWMVVLLVSAGILGIAVYGKQKKEKNS